MGLNAGNMFRVSALAAHESVLNDWWLKSSDLIVGAGAFTGTRARKELLVVRRG